MLVKSVGDKKIRKKKKEKVKMVFSGKSRLRADILAN